MDEMSKLLYDTKRLMMLRYPRFGSEIASANISFRSDLRYHTAATDGKNIFFDPEFLVNLSESDRLFLIAHELMHIKFAHAYRLEDKDGKKRDPNVWNEATDAIINANLERDGFKIKEGYVNRPEALKYSAEEFYQILLDEKKKKESEQQQNNENGNQDNSDSQENQSSNDMNNEESQYIGDDHSLWEEAFEKRKIGDKSSDESNVFSDASDQEDESSETQIFDEKSEFSSNREERLSRAKESLERQKNDVLSSSNFSEKTNLGPVGESEIEFDWKMLLRREIEKTELIWTQRRSIAENNYAYRLEEYDVEDEAETEVMIDVSGSVSLDLVKSFLRVLKPLLKESKLRVGCFNEKFWGMTEIKSTSDIDRFEIPTEARGRSSWTEDWDLAVRSFTKKREINKIVFTDGYPCPGTMPKEDLKRENVIWLVYGNKNFNPCCGKVIQINESQIKELYNFIDSDETKKRTM